MEEMLDRAKFEGNFEEYFPWAINVEFVKKIFPVTCCTQTVSITKMLGNRKPELENFVTLNIR